MSTTNVSRRRELPPLDLLRGFESAARLQSFTLAAAELSLTQSAISRQIQALEEDLGVSLFKRAHRSLSLTDEGRALQHTVTEVLRQLREVTAALRQDSARVTVTTTFGFASIWLIPRLARFRLAHPDIDIHLSASNEIVDLERSRIHIAVRYCAPELAPAGAVKLFDDEVIPVCAPALVQRAERPLRRPSDLSAHVLLRLDGADARMPTMSWRAWLEAMNLADMKPAGELWFSHYDQMIQAALDGQGVALCGAPLVAEQLRAGKLAVPFDRRMASPRAYYVVVTPDAARRREVDSFVAWLSAEARGPESA